MICDNMDRLKKTMEGVLAPEGKGVRILDEKRLRGERRDDWVWTAVV